jgi:predicted nucleic acid-binding protein
VIVLDASAVVELVLRTPAAAAVEARIVRDPSLHAPDVIDLEVTHVVRRYVAVGDVTAARGGQAIDDLLDLPLRRYPHRPLIERVWQLRERLTAYDAAYVALAELLDATLVTRDRRLGRARGHRAEVEVI